MKKLKSYSCIIRQMRNQFYILFHINFKISSVKYTRYKKGWNLTFLWHIENQVKLLESHKQQKELPNLIESTRRGREHQDRNIFHTQQIRQICQANKKVVHKRFH